MKKCVWKRTYLTLKEMHIEESAYHAEINSEE